MLLFLFRAGNSQLAAKYFGPLLDHGRGLRSQLVTALEPAVGLLEDYMAFHENRVGRLGKPEEIAATVAFLASDAAAFITGAVIDVNGGMYMG